MSEKKKIRIIMKSGSEIHFYCDDLEIKADCYGNIENLKVENISGSRLYHLKLSEIEAIIQKDYNP